MDLTPGPEVYRACAEASWEAPGTQRHWHDKQRETYIELMVARPDWRAMVDSAYRAGREDAARDIRSIAVGHDVGNILRDLCDLAADLAEGKYPVAEIRLVARGQPISLGRSVHCDPRYTPGGNEAEAP